MKPPAPPFAPHGAPRGATFLLLLACVLSQAFGQPAWESHLVVGSAGPSRMQGPGQTGDVSSRQVSLDGSFRLSLPVRDWYFHLGLQADDYAFTSGWDGNFRLRDVAAPLGLEYFQGGQAVAALSLQPGFYFQQRISRQAFDVPVQALSGIPLSASLHGVAGIANARFFHHALPIFGLVWEASQYWRGELVYPEPALIYMRRSGEEWRFGGSLGGGGYLGESAHGTTRIEYSSYRAGLTWSRTGGAGFKYSLGTGVELMRNFDYFQQNLRRHGSGAYFVELQVSWQKKGSLPSGGRRSAGQRGEAGVWPNHD